MLLLLDATDPVGLIRSWGRPYNADGPGGRVRLDSTPNPHVHAPYGWDDPERARLPLPLE